MSSREPRRPGEDIFDWLDRTTDPRARMDSLPHGCSCCPRFEAEPVPRRTRQQILDRVISSKRGGTR